MRTLLAMTLIAALAFISACSAAKNTPTAQDLSGSIWVLEDINGKGVIDYARTSIIFRKDGNIRLRRMQPIYGQL